MERRWNYEPLIGRFHRRFNAFAVTFKCSTKFMNLNSWDKDERPEAGWIKFQGKDGNVTTDGDDPKDCQSGSGATVDGYLNVLTNQIEFIVNYNMMNVRTETFQQTIDKIVLIISSRNLNNTKRT